MKKLLLPVVLLFTLSSCAGAGEALKDYAGSLGDKLCEEKDNVVKMVDSAAGAVLPPFLTSPVAGVIDLGLTFFCETAALGLSLGGEAAAGIVDPVNSVMNIGSGVVGAVTGETSAEVVLPDPDTDG